MPRRLLSILLLVVASGCLITPEVFDDARARFTDGDGDGFSELDGDCDPLDPATYPGAIELCDGRDNDCDGTVDNHPPEPIWFRDADADGFGDPLHSRGACEAPAGFVPEEGDCDDGDASRFPGQLESCNDRDDDCDGTVDEGASGDRSWYPDTDGDGFGSSGSPIVQCAAPGDGYVQQGGDCDDTDADVFPGAEESCNDRDDDCDGTADEAPTIDPLTWTPDADGDGYGSESDALLQCQDPGPPYQLTGGDCDDSRASVHPGADEQCNGVDDDCDGTVDDPPTTGDGTWYPDRDGDGYGDDDGSARSCVAEPGFVSVGGDCDDLDRLIHPAAVEICNDATDNNCNGTPDACVWDTHIDLSTGSSVQGASDGGRFGGSLAVGDLDGDGVAEWWTAVPDASPSTSLDLHGWEPSTSPPSLASADVALTGLEDGFGLEVAIGDLDGDGWDDLLAAPDPLAATATAGGVGLVYGPLTATAGSLDWQLLDADESVLLGAPTRVLADLDGDGVSDFGVGAPADDDGAGLVHLFTHVDSGTQLASEEADITVRGDQAGHALGVDLTAADFDGDGRTDLAVGEDTSISGTGAVRVFLGTVRGERVSTDADITLYGESAGGHAGHSLASFADVNGDGYADLAAAAPDDSHAVGTGSVYLIWGSASLIDTSLSDADIKLRGDLSDERAGVRAVNPGDLDLDGHDELVVTSRAEDHTVRAYLYFGPFTAAQVLGASSDAHVTLEADADTDSAFEAVVPVDSNADGVLDLLLGVPEDDASSLRGLVYIAEGVGF